MSQRRVVALTVGLALSLGLVAAPAAAVDETPKRCNFFCDVERDFKNFATSRETAVVLGAGLGASLLASRFDDQIAHSSFNSELFDNAHLGGVLEPGEVGGGAPVQFGLALGTLAFGKFAGNSTASQLGSALVRAQLSEWHPDHDAKADRGA